MPRARLPVLPAPYVLRLYVSSATAASARAIVNVRRLCERHLAGRYELEIIDIAQHPERVRADQIIAAPTLVRHAPLPLRRFIGDMSRTDRLLQGLGLPATAEP